MERGHLALQHAQPLRDRRQAAVLLDGGLPTSPFSEGRKVEGGRRRLISASHNKPISITRPLKGTQLPAVSSISGKQKRRKARSLNGALAKMPLSHTQVETVEASASADPSLTQLLPLIQQRRNLPHTTSEGLQN